MLKKTSAEPFRIKMVEPLKLTTRAERVSLIEEAGFNTFNLRAEDVYIDLLTDSGTSAMSHHQWSALLSGDEAYAGSQSFYRLKEVISDLTGYDYVLPTHQGRGAENIFTQIMVKPGQIIPGNMHFDTTRGHLTLKGGKPMDLVIDEGLTPTSIFPFKGNLDTAKLAAALQEWGPEKIPFILVTITCNNNGGQPVSLANIKEVRRVADQYGVPVFFDIARFAENCYFIKNREAGYEGKSIKEIAREIFSHGDGCLMSAKKDGLVNIGGFMAFRNPALYNEAAQLLIVYEGFPTYGGMAGRDMDALACGLREVVDLSYLAYRIGQVEYLAKRLLEEGVPIVEPAGGHAVYLDSLRFAPHIPQSQFPGIAIVNGLYVEGGIRGVELGSCAFGEKDPKTGEEKYPALDLVRLTIPRRVYTNSHMDVVAETAIELYQNRDSLQGYKIIHEAPVLRHFTARFEPLW
jgi:tyrosine phenol-lyase